MKNIAIFSSGNGSNFEELVLKSKNYKVKLLFCDRKNAHVIERAKKLKIPYVYLSIIKEKENFENKINEIMKKFDIELIVLAGYMKVLTKTIVDKWLNKIINIHPSLLPKYKGINSIKYALENNEKETGITIHYVDHGVDTGKIIFQKSMKIKNNSTLEEIETKIHKLEHKYYPKIINKITKGEL